MTGSDIVERAAAKVNLTLRVGRARADGYHPLDSLVLFADWGDAISVQAAPGLTLTMSGEASRALASEPSNLVLRAARALQVTAGLQTGAAIHLEKLIPVSAGLGGGSADAAATLRALNRLWRLDWPTEKLAQLALELGADVPACLYSRPLRMRGIGEWIEMLGDVPPLFAVIVNAGIPVSTADVFKAFDAGDPQPLIESAPDLDALPDWLAGEPNDLQSAAISVAPDIARTLELIAATGRPSLVRMSGSGASCFGLYNSLYEAMQAAGLLRAALPDWTIVPARLGEGGDA
ncbi:4-(cytidine 5'-diphospho)-2-C-methyl-D-erythritol kinase [Maricaulis salignorans]|uniref:4-diphosphocytidyl-2-C-methyl-D-erythritol kinase n=1 Tax=Maricaulis salignorans TaxID=144026 RepID=A0A1G9RL13_9PROT|nr:4-(cytidine 5'-diphospho)-2-C-methyl-D-erythritol kinase [Maricaulis salignorans]SDM23750.1 4-diphosphocytidyl-2-C-methyl-D-erythritol kinase [Maricaulis salignorans]